MHIESDCNQLMEASMFWMGVFGNIADGHTRVRLERNSLDIGRLVRRTF